MCKCVIGNYLLVEHAIPLVDVGNVTIILVGPLSRELALLVNTE